MILGNPIMVGGGSSGFYPSVLFTSDYFTSSGSVTMTGSGKTYNGVWGTKQVPNPAYRNLPSGYTQVEYIEGTGTQYINTNIDGNNCYKIEGSFKVNSLIANWSSIFSGVIDNFTIGSSTAVDKIYLRLRTNEIFNHLAINTTSMNNIVVQSDSYTLNGATASTGFSSGMSLATSSGNIYIANNSSLSRPSAMDIGEIKLYGSSFVLSRDFVPCKNSSNEYGMYDLVTDTFFGNQGTGAFTGGEEVPQYLTTYGFLISKIKDLGTYSYTATQGALTKTGTVNVDVVTDYTVEVNFIAIVDWATGTDAQIMAMIEADRNGIINLQDYWEVGDTRSITLSAMSATGVGESHASQTVEMVLMDSSCTGFTYTSATASGRTTPRFMVGQRHCLNEKGYMNSSNTNSGGWMNSARRTWCNSVYYNAVPSTIREAFKQFTWKQGKGGSASSGLNTTQDYFALPPEKAIFGSISYSYSDEGALYSQWTHYQTSSNRIKNVNGSAERWWECSSYYAFSDRFCAAYSDGSAYGYVASMTNGLAPFGVI